MFLVLTNFLLEGSKKVQHVTNHPVHFQKYEDQDFPPTALIPFCEFGGNLSSMGTKIDQMESPVCNSFKAKVIRNQLCYQVDPNKYKHQIDLQGDLSLSLFINHNEDKEMALENTETMAEDDSHEEDIIIGTIGNHFINNVY